MPPNTMDGTCDYMKQYKYHNNKKFRHKLDKVEHWLSWWHIEMA
jgi:hypothetical protein